MPNKQVKITCEYCKKPFMLKPSLAKSRRFCCHACRVASGMETKQTTQCPTCGKAIESYKKYPQKYCSYSCETTARNLTDQNPAYHRDISGENNPMYGKGQNGESNGMYGHTREKNPAWKGGRKTRKDGYILVIAPENHPYAISNGRNKKTKYILEHRFVMEQHLGRYLEPSEVVHHIDENPSNNNISNLKLYSSQSDHISDAH